jgi:hypothetical protein
MPRPGFEPVTPATKRPQTYALDRAATGIGNLQYICSVNLACYVTYAPHQSDEALHLPTFTLIERKYVTCIRNNTAFTYFTTCIANRQHSVPIQFIWHIKKPSNSKTFANTLSAM